MSAQGGSTPDQAWTLEVYESADGSSAWTTSFQDLDPVGQMVLQTALRVVLARLGNKVCETEWGKSLGKGLYEFRVRRTLATICRTHNVDVPPGVDPDRTVLLRAFFSVEGERVVLLLSCYDKGADSSDRRQAREIKKARKLLTEHLEHQRRLKARRR